MWLYDDCKHHLGGLESQAEGCTTLVCSSIARCIEIISVALLHGLEAICRMRESLKQAVEKI